MDWKQFLYKLGKGAASGALASLATLSLTGLPLGKTWPIAVAAVVSGALHGITNILDQKAG